MDKNLDLSSLTQEQIDADTFRRVWARVMPNQRNSPIVVEPRKEAAKPKQKPPARPAQGSGMAPVPNRGHAAGAPKPKPEPGAKAGSAEEQLRILMDMAQEGAAAGQLLIRRAGMQGKALSGLTADRRQALRRLSAAYFLETGRRYQPKGASPALNGSLDILLRGQFLWEQRWAEACRRMASELTDRALRELCQELAQSAERRRRTIRTVLERI